MTLPTQRQFAALRAVEELMAANGYPPTYRELCDALGVTINAVHDLLDALIRKDCLERVPHVARGLRLTAVGLRELSTHRAMVGQSKPSSGGSNLSMQHRRAPGETASSPVRRGTLEG